MVEGCKGFVGKGKGGYVRKCLRDWDYVGFFSYVNDFKMYVKFK